MTFIDVRPRRLWKHWFGSKKSHSGRVRRMKCWGTSWAQIHGRFSWLSRVSLPPHQHPYLPPTHKPTLDCFVILYVPYPCFGIFVNSVLCYVKCIRYLIETLFTVEFMLSGMQCKKIQRVVVIVAARNCVKSVRCQTCCHALSRLVCILTITWLQSWPEPICRDFFDLETWTILVSVCCFRSHAFDLKLLSCRSWVSNPRPYL